MTAPSSSGTRPSLASLLEPLCFDEFLDHHWPGRHVAIHGDPARLPQIEGLARLRDPQALIAGWPRSCAVTLPDKADEHGAISVGAVEAARLYANGMSVVLTRVEEQIPALRRWLAAIARDLGLPATAAGRCIVYASPAGSGVGPHFDQNANLVLQLQGEKRWWLAPNRSIEHPTERYAMNMAEVPAGLRRLGVESLPRQMPADAEGILLRPGSVLFLPRGTWHATSAGAASLSLNFTFAQPSWADLFTAALHRRLTLDARWRAVATGAAGATPARRAAAAVRFADLIGELEAAAGPLRADELLAESVEGEPLSYLSCYQRTEGVEMRVEEARVLVSSPDSEVEIEIDDLFAGLLRWIAGETGVVTFADLCSVGGLGDGAVRHVVETLIEAGALQRC